MYLVFDAIHDLWRVLRRQRLPEERIDRYVIMAIVLSWTFVATVTFVLGLLTWETLVGPLQSAHPVVATLLWPSWPAIAVGGSLLTYRSIHRRELVEGTGKVYGMREQVRETDRDLGKRIVGTTLHYRGYEVGDEIIGWAENLEVTVSRGGIFVEALHEDAAAAEKAATERASDSTKRLFWSI